MANLSNINNKFIVTSETEALIGATSWAGVGSGTLAAGLVISGNTSQFILDNPSYNHFTMYSAGDSNIYNIFGSSGNYLIGTGNKDTSSWSEKMRIDSSGFVGINNVAVASQRMTIGATAGQYGFAINALNAAGGVKRERVIFYYNSASDPDAGYLGIKASASDDLNHVFSTGPSNSYVCNITGNFGIGTNSPDTRLHVVGPGGAVNPSSYSVFDVTIENSGQSDLGIIGTTYSGVYFGDAANALEGALVYYHGDNHMSFRTNGNNEKMRITSGGNLVIKGQVNPQLYFESTTSSATMLGIVGADYTASAPYNANRIAAFNSSHLAFETGSAERMRITSGGDVEITGTYPVFSVTGTGSVGSTFKILSSQDGIGRTIIGTAGQTRAMYFENDGKTVHTEDSYFDKLVYGIGIYNNTTASAANMHVSSAGGQMFRSTSSLKYKTDVRDYDKGLNEVMQLQPKYYKGKDDGDTQFAGLIAEDVHELGLTEFVQYAEDGTPDALAYSHMIALLTKSIQELKAEVDLLKSNKCNCKN
jgi:hypothetical protein